jgi:hypothetical protein
MLIPRCDKKSFTNTTKIMSMRLPHTSLLQPDKMYIIICEVFFYICAHNNKFNLNTSDTLIKGPFMLNT